MPTFNTPTYKKIAIGVGCIMVFVIVVLIVIFYMTNGLMTTINRQLAALRVGDIKTAYSYTSADFRNATSLKDFEDFVNHFPALKDNKYATFSEKETKDDTGLVKGILYSREGASMPFEYLLVKEEGVWKIMGIQANPASVAENVETPAAQSNALTNTYENKDSRYIMKYPASWEYERAGDGTVIFSGKRGTAAFFSTVNIQTVLTKKNGGDFSTVKQFMTDIKHQAVSQSPGVKFFESGPIMITEKSGAKDNGEYTIFSYQYKGKEFKQWQIVVLRHDEQVFYAWAYTSPISQYPNDLAIAKSMLQSWVIY